MSIRELGLKELRALAQQRLGTKAAELKTRQELVDALEKLEKKKAPRLMVPLAAPLPAPEVRPPAKELPPELMIWTGDAPLPQITALPLVKEFPKERLVWSAQVIVAPPPVAAAPLAVVAAPPPFIPSEVDGPAAPAPPPFIPSEVEGPSAPAAPATVVAPGGPSTPLGMNGGGSPGGPSTPLGMNGGGSPGGPSTPLGMNGLISPAGSSTVSTVTAHFFLEPEKPRLPLTYEDDRVLTFARDPKSLYASWDIEPSRFDEGPATGRVVNEAGATVHSFAVAGPSGGLFVDQLPPGEKVKIEVSTETGILGESGWVTMPSAPKVLPADPINAPSSVV